MFAERARPTNSEKWSCDSSMAVDLVAALAKKSENASKLRRVRRENRVAAKATSTTRPTTIPATPSRRARMFAIQGDAPRGQHGVDLVEVDARHRPSSCHAGYPLTNETLGEGSARVSRFQV